MQPRLFHSIARTAPVVRTPSLPSHLRRSFLNASPAYRTPAYSHCASRRAISSTTRSFLQDRPGVSSNSQPASELNNNVTQEEQQDFDQKVAQDKEKQIRTPWHREGSDLPPVSRQRSAGAMTKGGCLCLPRQRRSALMSRLPRQTAHDPEPNAETHTPPHHQRL